MRLSAGLVIGIVILAPATPSLSAGRARLQTLFPSQAEVTVTREGLARLELPPEILSACRPDLSDLRLFDDADREIPFLVDNATAPTVAELTRRIDPALLETKREEIRREDGPALRRETFEIELADTLSRSAGWALVIETARAEFVARVSVNGIEGDETFPLVEDGSLFRLSRIRGAEKLRLPLPELAGDRLRVVFETEHSFWLEPSLRLMTTRSFEHGSRIAVPLRVLSVRSIDGKTVVQLARPRGLVADRLAIDTATRSFDRPVRIRDEGPGSASGLLGAANLFRVDALVPVEELEVDLRPASGDRLHIEIDDGDSPALDDPSFTAVVRQPSLIFSVDTVDADGIAARLRFGGGRAHAPRYDLAGLLPESAQTATGSRAEAAAALHDPAVVGAARLGSIRANPDYDGEPALGFAMRPGAEIDRRVFSHARALHVGFAPEGLSHLALEAGDLAVLREDLSDLRIADEESRQWPYLLEPAVVEQFVPLSVGGPENKNARSHYKLTPPMAPLLIERLILDVDSPFFDRGFRLVAVDEDDEQTLLAGGRLQRPRDDPRPIEIHVVPVRAESLELIVEDGDDAPLRLVRVEARLMLPKVYLAAPEGNYDLLLGAPDQRAPRYELEQVRDVVLAVQAVPVEAAVLQANDLFSMRARLRGGMAQRALLWIVLVAAVVVLAVLTLRLARRDPGV